jgi:dienelactone hydrolase
LCSMLMVDTDTGPGDAKDSLGSVSARPDFTCLIYAGFDKEVYEKAKPGIGPCFIAMAANDKYVKPQDCARSFVALQELKVPCELHVFQGGGHGFNIGKTSGTESTWPDTFAAWLKQNRFSRK